MPAVVPILFGALFTIAVALAAGRLLLQWAGVEPRRSEVSPLAFVVGSAALSLVMFGLLAMHIARRGVLLAVGLLVIAAAVRQGVFRPRPEKFPPLSRGWKWLLVIGFLAFTVLYFFNALAPEFSPDGSSYHLSFVSKYVRAHGFVHIPTNMYASLSQGVEVLYVMAFAFGKHSAAALVHYAFLVSLALLLVSFGRRAGYPGAGIAAALLVYASPVAGIDGTTAYIDVAVAAILFAVFYLLHLWDQQRRPGLLILIGLVAGFGFAAKYTAFLAVPYAAGFVLWRARRWKPAAVVALCSLSLAAPWVIKNMVWAGNPVSPMLNSVFPNPSVHVLFEQEWSAYLRHYSLTNRADIPVEATVRGDQLNGIVGPVFLLLPIALYALRLPLGRRTLLAGAIFVLPYIANIGSRFLIPALPFFALAVALALYQNPRVLGALAAAHCLLSAPFVTSLYCGTYAWRLTGIPMEQALRLEPEDRWLSRKFWMYGLVRMIENQTPPGSTILTLNGVPEAYTTRNIVTAFQSASGEVLLDIFRCGFNPDYKPSVTKGFPFPEQSLRSIRVVQTGTGRELEQWSVTELRLYHRGQEIPRDPAWRITSRPNPWDIQLAFDGSPVTRWRTWEQRRPGMYIDVDLGSPKQVDGVRLEMSPDSAAAVLRLEGVDATGRRQALGGTPVATWGSEPGFMGRGSMRELKARGIDYLLIQNTDFGAGEVAENPEAWGLTLVATLGDARLLRIDAGLPELVVSRTGLGERP